MQQKITVFGVAHRYGTSKKTQEQYSIFQAFYQSEIQEISSANYNLAGKGFELKEIFIPESEFEKLNSSGVSFPVDCDVLFDADLSTGRLRVKALNPTK